MFHRFYPFLLLVCAACSALAQPAHEPRARLLAQAAVPEPTGQDAQQERRAALRAALQRQNGAAPKPEEGVGQGRQLSPQERQELRQQLRLLRRDPVRP